MALATVTAQATPMVTIMPGMSMVLNLNCNQRASLSLTINFLHCLFLEKLELFGSSFGCD